MSPVNVVPFYVVTDVWGKALRSYNTRQGVGTKLRNVTDGRAFYWSPSTGLVEVTETFWWGCWNVLLYDTAERGSQSIPGRIYRQYR